MAYNISKEGCEKEFKRMKEHYEKNAKSKNKHKAVIIGAGRMGVGFNWPRYPYVYTHGDAYMALKDSVELVAVVDPIEERLQYAEQRFGILPYTDLQKCLDAHKPDIISVCTKPEDRAFIETLPDYIKGVWCEKPWTGIIPWDKKVQVNYIRRFDQAHQMVHLLCKDKDTMITAWAKDEPHTTCHFEDLARWFDCKVALIDNSAEIPSTNTYVIDCGKYSFTFRNGGMSGGFMEIALGNLLDAVEGKAELISPAY